MIDSKPKHIKILFVVWGYSIHAKRRISIFLNNSAYKVAVVSTYDYNFPGAQKYLLTSARPKNSATKTEYTFFRIIRKIGKYLSGLSAASRIFMKSGLLKESGGGLRHLPLIISIIFTRELSNNVVVAVDDFRILQQATEDFKPDLIFLQTLLYPCYLSYFLPRNIPIVITFWNGDVTWWAQYSGLDRLLKKQLVKYGVMRAQAITVNSQVAYDACLGYGIPDEKVHLIRYPGVDLNLFKPASQETAKKKLNLDTHKVIFCPRGIGGYLNSDVIIEAAALVIEQIPDALFLFIVGEWAEAEWQKHVLQATKLGILRNIRRDDLVSWEEMPSYYQASKAVVSISSNDSLPNCMLEAMACGIPLVMGNIPQISEWVTDGVNGLLIPPRDSKLLAQALLSLLVEENKIAETFKHYNIELIYSAFDSRKNSYLIRNLVTNIVYLNSYNKCIASVGD